MTSARSIRSKKGFPQEVEAILSTLEDVAMKIERIARHITRYPDKFRSEWDVVLYRARAKDDIAEAVALLKLVSDAKKTLCLIGDNSRIALRHKLQLLAKLDDAANQDEIRQVTTRYNNVIQLDLVLEHQFYSRLRSQVERLRGVLDTCQNAEENLRR